MRRYLCAARCVVRSALVLVLVASGPGFAQEAGKAASGSIEVSAPAWSPLAAAPGAPITVIDAQEIAESGASNLGELLEGKQGIVVNRSGAGPGVASASIRGSSTNQVLVVIDGVRVNDSRQGGADLSLISTDSIEKVEILTTGASAIYGPDALGGAIVITTKKTKENRLSAELSNVSYPGAVSEGGASALFDTQKLSVNGGLVFGASNLGLSASAERSLSAYSYGGDELRKNSDYKGATAKADLETPLAGGKLGASVSGRYRDASIAGALHDPSDAAEGDSAIKGEASWSSDALFGGLLSLNADAHGSWSRLDYQDYLYSSFSRHDMTTAGFDLWTSYFATKALEVEAGLTGLYEGTQSTAFESLAEGQPSRVSLGAYLEPKYLAGDRLVLAPIVRYDWSDNYTAGLSIMATARWQLLDVLELRASGGSSYRAPTFNELYWPYVDYGYGYSYQGNPSLKPETAWSGDLGAKLEIEHFELSCSGFARYVDNLIVSNGSMPVNLDKALVPGASLELSYALGAFRLAANYEFLYPLDLSAASSLSDATLIESFSAHKVNASLAYRANGLDASISMRYSSERSGSYYDGTSYSTVVVDLPGVAIIDMGASYKAAKNVTVSLNVDNLFDADYEVIADYPMPGRSVTTKVKIAL
jgi:vitamin B12 transporter